MEKYGKNNPKETMLCSVQDGGKDTESTTWEWGDKTHLNYINSKQELIRKILNHLKHIAFCKIFEKWNGTLL